MKRLHISPMSMKLAITAFLFIGCAIAMTTQYANIAAIAGNLLVLTFALGLLHATLHLQKSTSNAPKRAITQSIEIPDRNV